MALCERRPAEEHEKDFIYALKKMAFTLMSAKYGDGTKRFNTGSLKTIGPKEMSSGRSGRRMSRWAMYSWPRKDIL